MSINWVKIVSAVVAEVIPGGRITGAGLEAVITALLVRDSAGEFETEAQAVAAVKVALDAAMAPWDRIAERAEAELDQP